MGMMSQNDYIAEYVREKNPELISSFDFIYWKIGKMSNDIVREIADRFEKAMNAISDFKAADDPEFEDESYYEYIKQKGIEYCDKHKRGDHWTCLDCPLRDNLFCINTEGNLITNYDVRGYMTAVKDYKYMIEEVTGIDKDQDTAR